MTYDHRIDHNREICYGDTCSEVSSTLQKVYREECMSCAQVYERLRRLQDSRKSVDIDEKSRIATS